MSHPRFYGMTWEGGQSASQTAKRLSDFRGPLCCFWGQRLTVIQVLEFQPGAAHRKHPCADADTSCLFADAINIQGATHLIFRSIILMRLPGKEGVSLRFFSFFQRGNGRQSVVVGGKQLPPPLLHRCAIRLFLTHNFSFLNYFNHEILSSDFLVLHGFVGDCCGVQLLPKRTNVPNHHSCAS